MPLVLRVGDRSLALPDGRPCVVGSGEHADLRLAHGSVAAEHARLELHGMRLRVTDLGSAGGTWAGGERVETTELKLGSLLRLGDIELRFEQETPAAAEPPPAPRLADRFREPRFDELMAEQLRHAPWIAISVVAHLLLVLLLLAMFPPEPPETEADVVLSMQRTETSEEIDDVMTEDPEVEVEAPEHEPVLQEVRNEVQFEEPSETTELFDPGEFDASAFGEGMFDPVRGNPNNKYFNELDPGGDATKFRRRVTNLQKTGLDIVFVFDSTQSMHEVLDETKRNIGLMLDVLRALLPRGAQVGVVTYRDHGPREEYLTREIPLSDDYYRVINFVQTVYANGGHDFPEAIYDAMVVASRMKWRKDAHHVIVLIGDAPAHANTERKLRSLVQRFARDKKSVVHTIMTPRDSHGIDAECRANFEMIADAGGGSCIPLGDQDRMLRDVMSLAIGPAHFRSLEKVYDAVDRDRTEISASAQAVVRRGDVDAISAKMRRKHVDHDLVRALSMSRDARVAHKLVELLRERSRDAQPHAIAFVLSRMLGLTAPPIDPVTEDMPDRRTISELERWIDRKLH